MRNQILLIEDEKAIVDSLTYALGCEGFEVTYALDGETGLAMLRQDKPDLVLLDLILPNLSGIDLCRIARTESSVPIIMLTAKTEEFDRIFGLEIGADDYIIKPFSIRELVARMRSVFRRMELNTAESEKKTNLQVGNIKLSLLQRSVSVYGLQVHLPIKQFEILKILMMNEGSVVRREEIFERVWGSGVPYDTGALDVHIRWLRQKIEHDDVNAPQIKTIRRMGYSLVNPCGA